MNLISTYIRRCLYFAAVLLALCGCNERLQTPENGTASLKLVLSTPTNEQKLKSVSSDPSSPEKWTQWERAVDGRYIYRVTAFLLQGERLIAHKDIVLDGEVQETEIDFEANFTHGSYTLMAVANYSAHQAEDGSNGIQNYDGLKDLSATIEDIKNKGIIDNFTNLYSESLLNYKIKSTNGVCARVPQPLTLVKEIELQPGVNNIYGELLRTYSRVRIAMENNSDEELKISSLQFNEIFTQSSAYIFPNKGYLDEKETIDVSSADALTPFAGTESEPLVIPAQGTSVVFDGYILESKRNSSNETYGYSMGLAYNNLDSYTLKSTTSIKTTGSVTGGYYVIYNRGRSTYLKAGSNSVTTGSPGTLKAGMEVSEEFVWTLDNTGLGNNRYYIGTAAALENGQTAYYLSAPSNNSVTLGANKSVYFTFANKNNYLSMQSSGSGNYSYLSVNWSNNVVGQRNNNNNNALFELYPVEIPSGSVVEIPLKTIDNSTGQSAEVNEIKRNDFINAIVKVSYNKNQGHFIYEVKDWGTAGGDVSFN